VILYTEPCYTKDVDIWVEATKRNAERLISALEEFGAPTSSVSVEDFSRPGTVFIFGVEPKIELISYRV
jgi:hypothetical protein